MARRKREIGIRLAVGGQRRDVLNRYNPDWDTGEVAVFVAQVA